jgi:hypothetical protein
MSPADPLAAIVSYLEAAGLEYEQAGASTLVVVLPGERKLRTTVSLVLGEQSLGINAFVARRPDENNEAVYRWLLERNSRAFGVFFAIDRLGDIYLVGHLPLRAICDDELDRILGCVLAYSDGSFNQLLELGFRSSIIREWEWRLSRGEPTANLAAFAHLRPPSP